MSPEAIVTFKTISLIRTHAGDRNTQYNKLFARNLTTV